MVALNVQCSMFNGESSLQLPASRTAALERAVGEGYGIERMSSDSGILLGIILNFCHFLSVFMGLTLEVKS